MKNRNNVRLSYNDYFDNDKKLDAAIKIDIYYSFDEDEGYHLDTDSITAEFEERLSEIEDDIENLNHERNDHLRTKHMEFPERETDGAEL